MLRTSDFGPRTGTSASPRLLVVGCGNPFAGDDSVGLEIVRRLRARGGCGCEFRELPEGGFGLIELFDRADIILFVDAILSDAPRGTLHLIPMPSRDVAPGALGAVSSHGWGLDEALRLALALGRPVPRLMLLGVELESVAKGAKRTELVDATLEAVVEHFPQIHARLSDGQSRLWSGHHSYPPGESLFLELTEVVPVSVRTNGRVHKCFRLPASPASAIRSHRATTCRWIYG
jgi:hydrogenase maturation protease